MKQGTTRQHYLPRYRLQHFLRSNNKYYVYSNGTNPNKRDRETGKNDSSFALCDKLYELTEVPSWTKHENLIETGLLANDVEPEDAGEIKKVINNIKANTKLSLSNSEWLGKYALRMLYRSPAYLKKIKSLPQFNDPMTYYAFMRFTQKSEHPHLTPQEWEIVEKLLNLHSDGTVILKNPHNTFLLPDSGMGICICRNSTFLLTPLTPSICIITSKGLCPILSKSNGTIVTATMNQVSTINKYLFFGSNEEVASFYKLNKLYIDDLKTRLKANRKTTRPDIVCRPSL